MIKSVVSSSQKTLNVWAVVLILWSFYRVTFKQDLPIWFDEFIAKPIVFLFPVYWLIVRFEQKKFFGEVGFIKKNKATDMLLGLAIGSLFIGIAILMRITRGLALPPLQVSFESGIWLLSTVMAASSEQILSTGFVFKRLTEDSKNSVRPIAITALLFFFLHIPVLFGVDKISGSTLLQMLVLNTVLSLITSVVFLARKDILVPILVHALYLISLPIILS